MRDERTNYILFIVLYLSMIFSLLKQSIQTAYTQQYNCRPIRYVSQETSISKPIQNIQNIKWAQDSLLRPGWPKVRTGPACPHRGQVQNCCWTTVGLPTPKKVGVVTSHPGSPCCTWLVDMDTRAGWDKCHPHHWVLGLVKPISFLLITLWSRHLTWPLSNLSNLLTLIYTNETSLSY